MITLKNGEIIKLSKGYMFTVTSEAPLVYNGFISMPGMFGVITMGAVMFRTTGQVYDSLTNNYYDEYISPMQLPFGLPFVVCECGGFKTYNSMATHYHSPWCPVNKTEERNGYLPLSWSS